MMWERQLHQIAVLLCLLLTAAKANQNLLEQLLPSASNNGIEEWKNALSYSHYARNLRHTVPSIATPSGCEYDSFGHEVTSSTPIDIISCPDACGMGKTFFFRVTTTCDGPYVNGVGCSSVLDCYVEGCSPESCESNPGSCLCPAELDITDPSSACEPLCPEPTEPPTEAPTRMPVEFDCDQMVAALY